MTVAQAIDQFFRSTGQSVFIEAEGKGSRIDSFLRDYNAHYSPSVSIGDDGIIDLEEDANKWGLELRCYFEDDNGFPGGVQVTSNRAYRPDYAYRFNDKDVIEELFDLGYRIGDN